MAQSVWGFDCQSFQLHIAVKKKYQGIVGKSEFRSFPKWINGGWEIQSIQPPIRKVRQRYSGIKGKSGFSVFKSVRLTGTVTDSVGGVVHYSVTVTSI